MMQHCAGLATGFLFVLIAAACPPSHRAPATTREVIVYGAPDARLARPSFAPAHDGISEVEPAKPPKARAKKAAPPPAPTVKAMSGECLKVPTQSNVDQQTQWLIESRCRMAKKLGLDVEKLDEK